MRHVQLVGVALGLLLLTPALRAQTATAVATAEARLYAKPGDSTPLRVAAIGTVFRVMAEEGEWIRVQFKDPDLGLREGYIWRRNIRMSEPNLKPMDLSVPMDEPAPAAPGAAPAPTTTPPASAPAPVPPAGTPPRPATAPAPSRVTPPPSNSRGAPLLPMPPMPGEGAPPSAEAAAPAPTSAPAPPAATTAAPPAAPVAPARPPSRPPIDRTAPIRTVKGGILDEIQIYLDRPSPSSRVTMRPFSAATTDLTEGNIKDETKKMQGEAPAMLARRFVAKMIELGPFADVTIAESDSTIPADALLIEGRFREIDPGSRAVRYLVGFGAGKSGVTVEGTVRTADGMLLATFRQRRVGVMGVAGGDSMGKLTSDINDIGEDLAKFLSAWGTGRNLK